MSKIYEMLPDLKLYINIEHPDFEDCYTFGYLSAQAEVHIEQNPYPLNSRLADQWEEGWWDGFYGQQPLFAIESNSDDETVSLPLQSASNEANFQGHLSYLKTIITLTGTIAATMWVGYYLLDWAA